MTEEQKKRARLRLYSFMALVSVPVIAIVVVSINMAKPVEFPVYGMIPEFELIEQSGAPFSRQDLNGKISLVDFMFTTCQGQCPLLTANMKKIQTAILDVPGIQLVSISVDPETDTPAVLKNYADKFGARQDRWHFLSGPVDEIRFLAQHGFRLSALPDGPEKVSHSFRVVLVDRLARIRGYYDGLAPETILKLAQHARILAENRDETALHSTSPLAAGMF